MGPRVRSRWFGLYANKPWKYDYYINFGSVFQLGTHSQTNKYRISKLSGVLAFRLPTNLHFPKMLIWIRQLTVRRSDRRAAESLQIYTPAGRVKVRLARALQMAFSNPAGILGARGGGSLSGCTMWLVNLLSMGHRYLQMGADVFRCPQISSNTH